MEEKRETYFRKMYQHIQETDSVPLSTYPSPCKSC